MLSDPSRLSRGGAWATGTVFVLGGLPAILIGRGIIVPPVPPRDPTPPWVVTCIGVMFVAAGMSIVLDYGIAKGVNATGDFAPDTPWAVRALNLLLGATIVGLMATVFGWVGFGRGPRHFSTTIYLPFMGINAQSGELAGRIAFGLASFLLAVMFVGCGVVGIRRLRPGPPGR